MMMMVVTTVTTGPIYNGDPTLPPGDHQLVMVMTPQTDMGHAATREGEV